MSAELIGIHHRNPEARKISKVVNALRDGAVILYPTDTGFTLGCEIGNKSAIEKLRRIRRLSDKKALTFICSDLSNISEFALVTNLAYRTIKKLIPGPYTFILPATKQLPRLAQHPTRKTAGIRVPRNTIAQSLILAFGSPIISITAKFEDYDDMNDLLPDDIIDNFINLVDIAICSEEYDFAGESTVINMITDDFEILREGANLDTVQDIIY